jgi:hypothetical protein
LSHPANTHFVFENIDVAGRWWLTPVTLAIQEAKIRRIVVRSQPRQIVPETLSREKPITKEGLSCSRCRQRAEESGPKPGPGAAQANSWQDSNSKKCNTKKGLVRWLKA